MMEFLYLALGGWIAKTVYDRKREDEKSLRETAQTLADSESNRRRGLEKKLLKANEALDSASSKANSKAQAKRFLTNQYLQSLPFIYRVYPHAAFAADLRSFLGQKSAKKSDLDLFSQKLTKRFELGRLHMTFQSYLAQGELIHSSFHSTVNVLNKDLIYNSDGMPLADFLHLVQDMQEEFDFNIEELKEQQKKQKKKSQPLSRKQEAERLRREYRRIESVIRADAKSLRGVTESMIQAELQKKWTNWLAQNGIRP